MSELILEYLAEVWELGDDDRLTFGGDSDLTIDGHPDLDGQLGVLSHDRGYWQLRNLGSSITLGVHHLERRSMAVQPGCTAKLPPGRLWISFDVGRETHEFMATNVGKPRLTAIWPADHPRRPRVRRRRQLAS